MRFVETSVFTAQIRRLVSDESYRGLQLALVHRPEQGAVIQGSHGLRKLRWAAPGRGKRGGLRIICYWDQAQDAIFLLFAYAKQERGDLTPDQVKLLARIVREEFG